MRELLGFATRLRLSFACALLQGFDGHTKGTATSFETTHVRGYIDLTLPLPDLFEWRFEPLAVLAVRRANRSNPPQAPPALEDEEAGGGQQGPLALGDSQAPEEDE